MKEWDVKVSETKNTVAKALTDALEVIDSGRGSYQSVSVDEFFASMEQRGIDLSVSQDTLLFLRGTGQYAITAMNEVKLV